MNIIIKPEVMIMLETFCNQVGRQEFSGIGFCTKEKDGLLVYDAVVLNVGNSVFTQIKPEQILELGKRQDAANGRLWFHRHPLGNGIPGRHNWSGVDEQTIQTTPLGGIPEIIQWSASIVRTPFGWVGRVDNHITRKTVHVEVAGQPARKVYEHAQALLNDYLRVDELQRRFDEEGNLDLQQDEFNDGTWADELDEDELDDEDELWYEEDDPVEETVRMPVLYHNFAEGK
jgi:hypothetical protein